MTQAPHDDDPPGSDSAAPPAPDTAVEELVARSAALKCELVEFAQHARFARQLTACLNDAGDGWLLDEGTTVRTIDHFALEYRLQDGATVVERFVAQRRPSLAADERAMLLGWREVVEGLFEVCRRDEGDGTVVLHNLIDDLRYQVHSNMGPKALAPLAEGMFVYCRIVPVHPAAGRWLISGHIFPWPQSQTSDATQAALEMATADPGLMRRNPRLWQQAWRLQAEDRAAFIALAGSDLVTLPPAAAQDLLTEHSQRRLQRAAEAAAEAGGPLTPAGQALTAEDTGRLPDDFMEAGSVGLIYDDKEGLNYYIHFGRLDALFTDPALASDHTHLTLLRTYLNDSAVSPLPLRRLTQRHPDNADTVFRTLLRTPGFSWQRDGETLLRSRKTPFFQQEVAPSFSVLGERLTHLLRTPPSPPPSTSPGALTTIH